MSPEPVEGPIAVDWERLRAAAREAAGTPTRPTPASRSVRPRWLTTDGW